MQYRGSTWPQVGDDVYVVERDLVGLVEDITGQGLDERFVVRSPAQAPGSQRIAYALKEIRPA